MEEYERLVSRATDALNTLHAAVSDDLDPEGGGVRWWHGYTDWKRLTLIGEYLLDALAGTSQSLLYASLATRHHREQTYADNTWLMKVWSDVGRRVPAPTHHDFFAASQRGDHERRRERTINMAGEQCFYHLAQALDRLASAMVAVGAARIRLLPADWERSLPKSGPTRQASRRRC